MIKVINDQDCCGCEACSNICPNDCILIENDQGFYYPKIQKDKCIDCGLCEKVCPMINHEINIPDNRDGFAGYIINENNRLNSTSGGAAFSFYQRIIELGGKGYGVVFDSNYKTVFSCASNIEQANRFQGSKYPQSRVGKVYREIKSMLKENETVLFIGTPCQVFGLHNFLGKDYKNLLLIDFICHGVPSPIIWEIMIHEKFKDVGRIYNVTFKNKEHGWKNWEVRIETDQYIYTKKRIYDPYMSSYLCGYNVRPSCYECPFKGRYRASDITIADAWGIPEEDKTLNDDKGLSAVILNTDKGKIFFESQKNNWVYKPYKVDDLIRGNKAYTYCIKKNVFRRYFFKSIKKRGVLKTLDMYAVSSISGKLLNKISTLIFKIKGDKYD